LRPRPGSEPAALVVGWIRAGTVARPVGFGGRKSAAFKAEDYEMVSATLRFDYAVTLS
jgi:hypothetical protein